jgi:hypothetical protein
MRKPVAVAALVVLALAATLGFVAVATPSAISTAAPAAVGRVAEHRDAIAAVPARSSDWTSTHSRDPRGDEQLGAVLLATATVAGALIWRRAARVPVPHRLTLCGPRAASRAPPAFA